MNRWLADGVPPPAAPPIELKALPSDAATPSSNAGPAGRGAIGPRWDIVRDENGLARGGIRLAAVAAPIAKNTGDNVGSLPASGTGERNCRLMGSLYPTHDDYVAKVREATEKLLKAGFLVKADADATIREAEKSNVGRLSGSNRTAAR
jgi:hypothetical protein